MRTFKVKEKCKSCEGTGIYKGIGERDGFGVVCDNCNGTGCHEFKYTYDEFTERTEVDEVVHVIKTNPGICVGTGNDYKFSDFGGMSYTDWRDGKSFPQGSEMRQFTCPAWWYQSADYKLKPNWNICVFGGTFSNCKHFENKNKCWQRFDKENKRQL